MGRLPLFYDSKFIGNTLVGPPGSTTGTADGPVIGTAHAWTDFDGNLWRTQGANFLGGATLETLNPSASTPFRGALVRPSGERNQDQMVRVTTIGGVPGVWMIYLRFNTGGGTATFYRFRLDSNAGIYADTIVAPGGVPATFVNTFVPGWDSSISHDFEVSAIGVNPVVITVTVTDKRTNLVVYQSQQNDFFSALHGVTVGSYAIGENSSFPGGPFFQVRLYGDVGQGPHYTYDAYAVARLILTAVGEGHPPPREIPVSASASFVLIANVVERLAMDFPVFSTASFVVRARSRASGVSHRSIVLTATAKRVSVGSASVVLTATAGSHVAHHKSGAATIRLFLLASAVKIIQRIWVTQLPIEVLRSRYTDTDLAQPRISQLCIEVLVPYVHSGTFYAKTAAATIVVTAHASNVRPAVPADADPEVILTAVASSRGVIRSRSIASASFVLTVTGDSLVGNFGAGIATLRLSASALNFSPTRPTFSFASIRLTARARILVSGVSFGDDYLGRFQQGQEVPLWVIVRDQRGSPAGS